MPNKKLNNSLCVQHEPVTGIETRIMSEQKRNLTTPRSQSFTHGRQFRTSLPKEIPTTHEYSSTEISHYASPRSVANFPSQPCTLVQEIARRPIASSPLVPPRHQLRTDRVLLTPSLVVEKYSKVLPLKLAVSVGVYGADRSDTFCEGDILTAQFLRRVSYVLVEEKSGNLFKLPVASRLHFGLLYNPNKSRLDQALKGYTFRTVEELLILKPMPKLVLVEKGWRGKDPAHTVEENDLLWVKGVHHDPQASKYKFLKCIQANTGLAKLLRSDTQLPLSTKPSLLLLPLTEIMKHSPPPFQGLVESPKNSDRSLPAGLKDLSIVSVHEYSSDLSIIATRADVPGIFDVPSFLDMDLHIVDIPEKDKDQMRIQSASLFASFSPAQVDQCLVAHALSKKLNNNSIAQKLLLKLVDQDHLKKTQQLIPPPTIRCFLPNPHDASRTEDMFSSAEDDRLQKLEQATQTLFNDVRTVKEQFLTLSSEPLLEMSRDLEEVKKLATTTFDQIPGIFNELNLLIGRMKDLEQSKVSITETLQQLQHTQKQQQEHLQHLQQQLEEIFQQQFKAKPQPRRKSLSREGEESVGADYQNVILGQTSDSVKKNIEYLEKLSVSQVAQLLKCLKMPEYIESFRKEEISGMILLHCTEGVLEQELRIKSVLHRMKLMQLISGRLPIRSLLQDEHRIT